jgi:hypothetical protein
VISCRSLYSLARAGPAYAILCDLVCETDLARQFPLAIVAKWLGNTQAVAMRHYVDVTDGDFERAVGAAKNPAQQAHADGRSDSQAPQPAHEKTPVLPEVAT